MSRKDVAFSAFRALEIRYFFVEIHNFERGRVQGKGMKGMESEEPGSRPRAISRSSLFI